MPMTASQIRLWSAAREYRLSGFSVIPCKADKKPDKAWREFTTRRATEREISLWYEEHGIPSIGLIGGKISNNVVFIDLDGIPAIQKFAAHFPSLCENTKSVLTGSQEGIHLYVRVDEIPDNINVRVQGVGGFEIRGNGQYVIAPPSPHPSGNLYRVHRDNPILELDHIEDVREWMANLRLNNRDNQNETIQRHARPQNIQVSASKRNYLNKIVSEEIARVSSASKGNRNNALFQAAKTLAKLAAGGELNWSDMASQLKQASSLPAIETERTIASAYNIGAQHPRKVS